MADVVPAGASSTGFFSMRGPTSVVPSAHAEFPAGPMDETQFATAVRQALADAVDYIDGFVARQRANATAYYRGDLFGNEEIGRSQIVMTEVRDTVLQMLPSLLRIFCSSDTVATFEPRTAEKVDQAEQATDYVNYIFYNDNDGFSILYNAFKDALVRKSGVLKWRWDDSIEIREYEFEALSDQQMQLLVTDPEVEILSQKSKPVPGWQPPIDPQTQQPVPIPTPQLHDVRVRRHRARNRVLIECVPVEELLVSRNGRDLDTCLMVAHRSLKTYSDLVKLGYSVEQLENMNALGDTFMWNVEAQARNPAINAFQLQQMTQDESSQVVVYNECYVRIDRDGDGIAELHKTCLVGQTVLHDEVVSEVPFAILCPDPEPHMIIGNSVADQTMDLQLLKSNVVRNTLDSLAQAIHPRSWFVEGQVNVDDMLNTETGAQIRMRAPGMAGEFNTTFVGQQAMPVIQWLDDVKTKRTGIMPGTPGLDADTLQSTTKTAVDAVVQGAQERTEMTARLFAENGIKRLMKGLLKLVCEHQDQKRMVRLRGKWVDCDPRVWDADMDVIVHVALGRGTDQDKLNALGMIAAKQELAIQVGGPASPLADISNYRNTLAKMTEILGYKNVEQFFKPIDMNQIQQAMQQAQAQPKQDPNMVVAQAQQAKVQAGIQIDQLKLQLEGQRLQLEHAQLMVKAQSDQAKLESDAQLKREQMMLDDQRQRDQARLDAVLKLQGLELQYGTQVSSTNAEVELERARLLADVVKHGHTLRQEDRQHTVEQSVDMKKHAMTIDQKDRAAELQAQAAREANDGGNSE